ncbi:flippase [Candidatus Jorgensenbacteria bacterium]|nr:flippase [Candidatus Jorgensenbacteria bacterium]
MFRKIKSFLFENKNTKQTVLKNSFWLGVGNIGGRLIRALLIIYAARILGTEGYGIFSYALGLAAFFTVFSDIGLSALLTRELVKNPDKSDEYFSTTFVIKFILVIITIFVVIFVAPTFTKLEAAKPLIYLVAILLTFDTFRNFGFAITRAQNRMELEALFLVTTDMAIAIFGAIALFINPSPKTLAISYSLGSAVGFIIMYVVLRKHLNKIFKAFCLNLIRPILSSAWPFAIMGLLGGFMLNIDMIILGWFRNAHELGLYAAAQRPVQLLYVLPALLSTSLFPIISNLISKHEHGQTKAILEKSIAGVLAFALPITMGGILLGAPIIKLLFGESYFAATLTFQLLMLTIIPIFPGSVIGNAIFAHDKQKIFIVSTFFGSLCNVMLDILLIPSFGIEGSAIATIISQIIANGYNWWKLRNLTGFKTLINLKKIIPATIGMTFVTLTLLLLHIHLLVNVVLSGVAYVAILYLLHEPLMLNLKPNKMTKS